MLGHLAVIEARLQRAVRCQKVSGTQVAGARLLDPYRIVIAGPVSPEFVCDTESTSEAEAAGT